ncbi:7-carboxy-7-deazaguanine synthase QueE [Candidatus Williamhamiltonella defendens]|uniref:7-carboxy-7-deazaguanine synthase n=1 Tax=Candidatus Hamiltonella defensa (Bemisia tabaci) TaxID=672795 RepID=A0A249DY35_9ENTR|nr:7-carboxy-7-deazaguanine synthase QueE [Candidatus Hamiltonella defensa]ASX26351.1 7-carboxy-7-deazaguanine synthase QueE [Candidatus Hamiltonella defensa (Bemisia tabaci)]CED78316.1 7-carboxy-7-deazaguanine synthase homolog [Candidatus Hamiltonella defensa (Bemisia tabaci)]
MLYPINEIFQTLQGEGHFMGTPAIFIRLQGCPVACSWCDTKHTWEKKNEQQVDLFSILQKKTANDFWSHSNEQELLAVIRAQGYQASHVVITGGEPCLHDLTPLTQLLEQEGYFCQIETSGTHLVHCTPSCWVTVSPKINMRGGFKIQHQALERADELKHVIARKRDIETLDALIGNLKDRKKRIISLQPVSQKKSATQLCIDTCIERNWRLSVQMHKYLGIE